MKTYHKMRALVVGRFQPPHKGHIKVLTQIAENYDQIIIGVGSAHVSHRKENPFTAGERILMLSTILEKIGKSVFYVVPIPDVNRHAIWVNHVESMCPPFDIVFSNNPLVRRLFNEAGYKTKYAPIYNREIYSGTEIRRRIIDGENWKELVPEEIGTIIEELDGINRLLEISEEEPML